MEKPCLLLVDLLLRHVRSAETQASLGARPSGNNLIKSLKRTTADEQDIRRVDLDEFLMRMLPPTLWRNVCCGALDDLQERLLHTFTRNVACDRWVIALARDLVDLVNIDDAPLRPLNVEIGGLDET